ncbi:precursor of CEP3 [Prosopis cineraria]|uniref:precursor of CEP3 n=1 Tax=Prosopis cineraria TaxID=364024 RepID=UPI00240EF3F7|nr:precursor of CEP3 [Prosopis cineraria]
MAQIKFVLCFVILALTLLLEFSSIEGRHLKSEGSEKFAKREVDDLGHGKELSTANAVAVIDVPPPSPPSEGRHVSDFRPTNPGHSPGVGHSVHN